MANFELISGPIERNNNFGLVLFVYNAFILVAWVWRRFRKRKNLLSFEHAPEVVILAVLVGLELSILSVLALRFFFYEDLKIETFPWPAIMAVFAAPYVFLSFYWRHLQVISDRLKEVSSFIYDASLDKRIGGYAQLYKITQDDLSLVPLVVELIADKMHFIGNSKNEKVEKRYAINYFSRIWRHHKSIWLERINLRPNMREIDFSYMDMLFVNLNGVNLYRSDFSYSTLDRAVFSDSCLDEAKFNNANLRNARFDRANMKKAVFRNADLTGAFFYSADISGADFMGATVTQLQIDMANGDQETVLPENIVMPDHWKKTKADEDLAALHGGAKSARKIMRFISMAHYREKRKADKIFSEIQYGGRIAEEATLLECRNWDEVLLRQSKVTKSADLRDVPESGQI